MHDDVRIGQFYCEAKTPRRIWQVSEQQNDQVVLERLDEPNITRSIDASTLVDSTRYTKWSS